MQSKTEWRSPDSQPALSGQSVHIWRAPLSLDAGQLEKMVRTLSDEERARAKRFLFERDRNSFVASHGILREVLGRYSGRGPGEIEFTYGPYGKPELAGDGSSRSFRFNLSHSDGVALIAVAKERAVGVDVEKIQPERAGEEIADRYFSREEVDELRALPAELRSEGFFLCWTRKEAYVKALGEGLRFPLDSFQVSLSPGEPAQLFAEAGAGWSVESFDPSFAAEARYAGAVVAEGKDSICEYFAWK